MFISSFREYLAHAEAFLSNAEQAKEEGNSKMMERNIVSCIVFSWSSIEFFINNMIDDFNSLPANLFELHERAFLLEKSFEFCENGQNAGNFEITNRNQFKRIDHKILFLVAKFGTGSNLDKGGTQWQKFLKVKTQRNEIVHPRIENNLAYSLRDGRDAIDISKETIKMVSEKVWQKPVHF